MMNRQGPILLLGACLCLLLACDSKDPVTPEIRIEDTVRLHIDSILVDELKHELVVFGDFSSKTPDSIYCDSVSLRVISKSPTEIRTIIPDTGKGSCGPVWAIGKLRASNARVLTYWHFFNYYRKTRRYGSGDREIEFRTDTVHLRLDFTSKRRKDAHFYAAPIGISKYVFEFLDSTYRAGSRPLLDTFVFFGAAEVLDPVVPGKLKLGNDGQIIDYNGDFNCNSVEFGGGTCHRSGSLSPARFLPDP